MTAKTNLAAQLAAAGCATPVADFYALLHRRRLDDHPGWTEEDLLFEPRRAMKYCAAVREEAGAPKLRDGVILRAMVNWRKRGYKLPSGEKAAEAPAVVPVTDEPFAAQGDLVRTDYGTGPYVVESVSNYGSRDGRPTYSLTLRDPLAHKKSKSGPFYLNDYQRRADGRVVANNGDELMVFPAGTEPGPTFWDWFGPDWNEADKETKRRWMRGEAPPVRVPADQVDAPPAKAVAKPKKTAHKPGCTFEQQLEEAVRQGADTIPGPASPDHPDRIRRAAEEAAANPEAVGHDACVVGRHCLLSEFAGVTERMAKTLAEVDALRTVGDVIDKAARHGESVATTLKLTKCLNRRAREVILAACDTALVGELAQIHARVRRKEDGREGWVKGTEKVADKNCPGGRRVTRAYVEWDLLPGQDRKDGGHVGVEDLVVVARAYSPEARAVMEAQRPKVRDVPADSNEDRRPPESCSVEGCGRPAVKEVDTPLADCVVRRDCFCAEHYSEADVAPPQESPKKGRGKPKQPSLIEAVRNSPVGDCSECQTPSMMRDEQGRCGYCQTKARAIAEATAKLAARAANDTLALPGDGDRPLADLDCHPDTLRKLALASSLPEALTVQDLARYVEGHDAGPTQALMRQGLTAAEAEDVLGALAALQAEGV